MHGTQYKITYIIRGRDLARTRSACLLDRQFPENVFSGVLTKMFS